MRHVFFAVLSAAELEISLPLKVELYLNAYFDGIRRHTPYPTEEERGSSGLADTSMFSGYLNIDQGKENSIKAIKAINAIVEDKKNKGKAINAIIENKKKAINAINAIIEDKENTFKEIEKNKENAIKAIKAINENKEIEKNKENAIKAIKAINGNKEKAIKAVTLTEPIFVNLNDDESGKYNLNGLRRYLILKGVILGKGTNDLLTRFRNRIISNVNKVNDKCTNKKTSEVDSGLGSTIGGEYTCELTKKDKNLWESYAENRVKLDDFLSIASQYEIGPELLLGNSLGRIDYAVNALHSPYIQFPVLWNQELQLDQARLFLRELIVNSFFNSYPGIPDPKIMKSEFLERNGTVDSLVYQWVRDLWVHFQNTRPSKQSKKVQARHFLDRQEYLTPDARSYLLKILSNDPHIYNWLRKISENQYVMDQLSTHLLDHLYRPLFQSLGRLGEIRRRPVDFKSIAIENYQEFRHFNKPKVQTGIQIVDLLPASRDDLVSMSVNEGGVIAKVAAKAEGAAAYDMNKLQMIVRNIELLKQTLDGSQSSESVQEAEDLDSLSEAISERTQRAKVRKFEELSDLSESGKAVGYSPGCFRQG